MFTNYHTTATTEDERLVHESISSFILWLSLPTFLVLYFGIDSPWGKHAPSFGKNNNDQKQQPQPQPQPQQQQSERSPTSISNNNDKHKGWLGPPVNARISFCLFELPNIIWSWYYYRDSDLFLWRNNDNDERSTSYSVNANFILLFIFVAHYVNRAIVYPLRMNPNSKPMPLLIPLAAFGFTNCNGYMQALNACRLQKYPSNYCSTLQFQCGLLLFFMGVCINVQSDTILRNLRKPGESGYKIPRGGFFEYCSGANYFGEIMEWLGYAIACNSFASFAFLIYTCSNLIPRGVSHHYWYTKTFKDYPIDRKAIIPFLW